MNDLRFALRQLRKQPLFTLIAVLSLALGIGANTTVLTWIDAALLRPIPGAMEQDRLIVIAGRHASGTLNDTLSYPDLTDLGQSTNVFSGVIASQFGSLAVGSEDSVEWVWGQITTANFFDVLGVGPALGRHFIADDDVGRAGPAVVVISDALWKRRYGGDPTVIGETLELNRHPFTIIGVSPPGFRGTMSGLALDVWVPLSQRHLLGYGEGDLHRRDGRWLHTLARLQPGVDRSRAQAEASTVMRRLEREYPGTNRNQGVALFPLWESPYGAQAVFLPLLRVLLGVAGLVFLLVVANVANLLLARATARSREIAVRLAVGASRARLLRQLLSESILLAALGGGLGLILSQWAVHMLVNLMPVTYLPLGYDLQVRGLAVGVTVVLTLVAGVLFGLAPAWQSGQTDLNATLKQGGRSESGRSGRHSLRSGLVVAQVALALVLLTAAGLCLKSFQAARNTHPGFSTAHVWLSGFRLGAHGYDKPRAGRFFQQLRQQLASAPGVEAAACADWLPLGFEGGSTTGVQVEGYEPSPGERMSVALTHVSPGYFNTLQIAILDGRDFAETDDRDRPRVVVVNQAFVDRFLKGRPALGARVRFSGQDARIIGVVGTGKYRSLAEPPTPFLYGCAWQQPSVSLTAVVRMKGEPGSAAGIVARETSALDAGVKVWVGISFEDFTAAAFAIQQIAAQLLLALGAVALILAAMGIYGIVAYSVSQRTREIGVRMALGAQRSEIRRLILKQGMLLALLGSATGLVGAFVAGKLMSSLLIGVHSAEPLLVIGVTGGLIGVALVACWIPARRASRVDPMSALRGE